MVVRVELEAHMSNPRNMTAALGSMAVALGGLMGLTRQQEHDNVQLKDVVAAMRDDIVKLKADNVRIQAMTQVFPSIRISNVVGNNAVFVNGTYDSSDERCGRVAVYRKRGGDDDMWIEYNYPSRQWQVASIGTRGTNRYNACVKCDAPTTLDLATGTWSVAVDGVFQSQPSVRVAVIGESVHVESSGGGGRTGR